MSAALEARLRATLRDIEAAGLQRQLRDLRMQDATRGVLDGQPVTVLCSNDYLGLAQHPEVVAAWQGAGAGSARLIAGNRPAHRALEEALSEHFGRPATVLSTGWHANLAALTTALRRTDRVSSDALNHASLIDGLRLSRAERVVVPHGATAPPAGVALHVTEGLFSMDGDRPDLAALAGACAAGGAALYVDEAHAVGALGPGGRGAAAAAGVEPDILVGTLGKAYGAFGAFVVGSPALRDLLLSQGRAFIFTTGLPEPACRAALAGLRLADDGRRQRLADHAGYLRAALGRRGIPAAGRDHIVPIELGAATMGVAQDLLARGFYVAGIRPPTVPPGGERLRVSLSAAHSRDQLDGFVDALSRSLDEAKQG